MARAERAHVEAGWLGTVWGAFADKPEAFVAESASHTELLVSGVLKVRARGLRHAVGVGALGEGRKARRCCLPSSASPPSCNLWDNLGRSLDVTH
jgi:hypothetical protein